MGEDRKGIHVRIGEQEYFFPEEAATALVGLIFSRVLAPGPENKHAGFIQAMRLAIKAAIRPFLGGLLKDLYERMGEPIPEIPRARDKDLLDWLIPTLASVGIRQVGKVFWRVHIDQIDPDKRLYQVRALTAESVHGSEQQELTSSSTTKETSEQAISYRG